MPNAVKLALKFRKVILELLTSVTLMEQEQNGPKTFGKQIALYIP